MSKNHLLNSMIKSVRVSLLLAPILILVIFSTSAADEPTARNPKLDSVLAQLVAAQTSAGEVKNLAESQSLRLSDNRVHIQIVTYAAGLADVTAAVTAAGGEVTGIGQNDTLIQGWLPIEALETVAAENDVYFIRRPTPIYPLENLRVGSSTTEGLGSSMVWPGMRPVILALG